VDVEGVIQAIRRLGPTEVTEAKYLKVRASKPKRLASIAASMLFLNKTGFNGLYRVNQSGEFNVPWGKRSWEPDYENLRAVARALRDVLILCRPFDLGGLPEHGDVVYYDPPYLPVAKTSFISYSSDGFGLQQHLSLGREFAHLAAKGVTVLASNSHCRESLAIYRSIPDTVIRKIGVRRNINRDGDGRAKVKEILAVHRGVELS
jgi:DNA adenine methylase